VTTVSDINQCSVICLVVPSCSDGAKQIADYPGSSAPCTFHSTISRSTICCIIDGLISRSTLWTVDRLTATLTVSIHSWSHRMVTICICVFSRCELFCQSFVGLSRRRQVKLCRWDLIGAPSFWVGVVGAPLLRRCFLALP
jgi:hypothetical protein